MMKVIVAVGLVMILWIGVYFSHLFRVPQPKIYQYLTLGMIAVVQPTVIYWTIKRNYESSNHLREPLEINANEKEINITGESFYTEIAWDKVYKIEEEKNWFLVYQNNLSAILISKKDLSEEQLKQFKEILRAIPKVPKHFQS
jgi:hypothetical protein